jgi:hypothetical protein
MRANYTHFSCVLNDRKFVQNYGNYYAKKYAPAGGQN